jgi:ribosome-binding protein aMBF1 (putative translation factor)
MSAVNFILNLESVAISSAVLHGKIVIIPTRGEQEVAKTNDALKILQAMTQDDPEMEEMIRESYVNARIAQIIYEARTNAGLTQQQLAERIGTKQSVIARLEDAEYEGHSLSMIQKIARALNQRLEVNLIPIAPEDTNVEQRSA